MSERNGNVEALAALINGARLSDEEKARLTGLVQTTKGKARRRARSKPHSGPWMHGVKGDTVTVLFPDGEHAKMTIWQVGPMKLYLSTLSIEQLENRSNNMKHRIESGKIDVTQLRGGVAAVAGK